MKLLRGTRRIRQRLQGCVATIGNFDGLHRGHQAIFAQVQNKARQHGLLSTVISFEPLPTEYFHVRFGKSLPSRIYPLRDKARRLQQSSMDEFVCLRFNDWLANMEPEEFIDEILLDHLNVQHLVVGDDFRFGKKRRGDFAMLVKRGKKAGMTVENTATVADREGRISSTRIRHHLARGEIDQANGLLGHAYQLSGRVRHGDKRGRLIGFPTLNQRVPENITAARGVYAVKIHRLGKETLSGMANLGKRPTVGGVENRLETHIFDYDGDAYGSYPCVELVKYVREEKKFDNFEALKEQIGQDRLLIRQFFGLS